MIEFDQANQYQFSLFLDASAEVTTEAVEKLQRVLSRLGSASPVRMKLGQPEIGQTLIVQPGGPPTPQPMVTWRAGTNIWRVVWTPSRLDVSFDARGYSEVTEEKVTLSRIEQQLVPNLGEVSSTVGQAVDRLALIVTTQTTMPAQGPRPSRFVAAVFFRQELQDAERAGNLYDAIGRTNNVTAWDLSDANIRVNRNETGTANSLVRNGVEETNLSWQWDVNTVPSQGKFSPLAIQTFFRHAVAWIDERTGVLQAIR